MSAAVRRIIFTSKAPAPIGPYSQGVVVDKTLYVSGQIGMTDQGQLVDGIEAQTRLALDNIGHILHAVGSTYSNLVKLTVLLTDMNHFPKMNQIYGEYFKENFPARAAYQVARLPKDALIEIEAVAVVGDIIESKL